MNHILWKSSKWYEPFPPLFIWHIWIFQSIPVFVSWHWGYDRCAQVPSISAREAPRNGVESNNAGDEKTSMEKRWKTMCIVYSVYRYYIIIIYDIYEKIQLNTMYFWLTYNYWTWTKIAWWTFTGQVHEAVKTCQVGACTYTSGRGPPAKHGDFMGSNWDFPCKKAKKRGDLRIYIISQ